MPQIYLFLSRMNKSKRLTENTPLDSQGLAAIHTNIIEKIAQLDKLNQQFKAKQQNHFLKTFMSVLERMGNDLILAQQAYQNIDLEIKRETYYQELVKEMNFYKNQCFVLKKQNLNLKQLLTASKIEVQNKEDQINSIKQVYQKKSDEVKMLKEKVAMLKRSIKMTCSVPDVNAEEKATTFGVNEGSGKLFEKKIDLVQRWVHTQQVKRRQDPQQQTPEDNTIQKKMSDRYNPSTSLDKRRSTNTSFRRHSHDKPTRTTVSPFLT